MGINPYQVAKKIPPVNFPMMAVIRGASQTVRHFPTGVTSRALRLRNQQVMKAKKR
jgi:hypothetical protein